MIKIRWKFVPDYRKSEYLDQIDLILCYSGKRYVALNVRHLTIEAIQRQAPNMVKALKKDMQDERLRRKMRKVRRNNSRRRP